MPFSQTFLTETMHIIERLDHDAIENAAKLLANLRDNQGRLFILGVGGSAANASHAVNDFRKITNIEAYAPTDNVSELTARTNDEGFASIFVEWLRVSRLCAKDVLLILSVGGGDLAKNISPNLVEALNFSQTIGAKTIGIVGRDGGYTKKMADVCILIPVGSKELITPQAESLQSVIWHLLVSHPLLKVKQTKWEAVVEVL